MATGNVTTPPIDDFVVPAFKILQPSFIIVIFVSLLYGAYTILFGLYVYLQVHQQGRARYYQVSILLLYLFALASVIVAILSKNQQDLYALSIVFTETIDIVAASTSNATITNTDIIYGPTTIAYFTSFANLDVAVLAIYVAANTIADSLLLYRCYIVWGSSKRVIAGPAVISLVNTGVALVAAALAKKGAARLVSSTGFEEDTDDFAAGVIEYAFFGVNLLTNLILTGLIAGRIWWISRTMNRLLNAGSNDKRVNGIAAMILESGLLYPVALIVGAVLSARGTGQVEPLLTVVVGIAPTLILVRTDLGLSIENGSSSDIGEFKDDLEMDKYGFSNAEPKRGFESTPLDLKDHEMEGYGWGSTAKGKVIQHRAWDVSDSEIQPTSTHYSEAAPPEFDESQQGSSVLISLGPPPQHEKNSGGLIIMNPPSE